MSSGPDINPTPIPTGDEESSLAAARTDHTDHNTHNPSEADAAATAPAPAPVRPLHQRVRRVPRKLLNPRAAIGRMFLAASLGVAATCFTPSTLPLRIRAVVGWDSGALLYIVLAWLMIARATPKMTRLRASEDDPGRRLVFVIALFSSLFSLFSAVVVLRRLKTTLPDIEVPIWTGLALAAVVLSWVVTHTVFTLRYAHLYYRNHASAPCMQFPGTKSPADLDFAYFAFTIGMCFQVSDVVVTTSRARRAVLLHALVSFVYNTTIVALSLNLVTSLLG